MLGSAYDALPAQVQALHDMSGQRRWSGTAQVRRGTELVSRLVAGVIGFPKAAGPPSALRADAGGSLATTVTVY